MLKINKTSEPNFLKEFKKKEKPKNWKDFDFEIKKELKNYMLENEQKIGNNSYCPYCERKIIASKNSQIEHLKPKDRFPELFLDYKNFITGCLNIESCGSKKSNKWSDLFINPVIDNPEKYFSYNRMTGEIIPRKDISEKARQKTEKIRKSRHFVPFFSAIVVVALFLFLQYNRLIFASVEAYVAPGNSNATQTIYSPNSSNSVGQEPKLIIPKINVDVPVVYGVGNDNASQLKAMEKGVAHFSIPGANAVPGQNGNTVLSGHSSNDLFDTGDYKFIFAQLDKLKQGDVIYANYNGKRYTYNVTKTEVVMPNQVNRVQIGTDKPMLTLITCVPLGTAEKRLLVFAEQVSPDPTKAEKPASQENSENKEVTLPRNSLTFFERLFSWKWD